MYAHNITSYSHNATADTISQTPSIQRENANAILTSKKLVKSDELAEMLKDLKINEAEYYVSESANANDEKGDPLKRSEDTYSQYLWEEKESIRTLAMEFCNQNY